MLANVMPDAGSCRLVLCRPPSAQNSRLPTTAAPTTACATAGTPRIPDSPQCSSKSRPRSQSSSAAENPERYVHDLPPLLTYQSQNQSPVQPPGTGPRPALVVRHAA